MTAERGDPGRDEGLEVPPASVSANGSDRRRAYAAAGVVIAVVATAIGLSVVSGRSTTGTGPATGPRTTHPSGDRVAASPGTTPGLTPRPIGTPPSPIVEHLPDIANVPLPDAGRPIIVTRRDTDAQILAWSPGDSEVRVERTFTGAFARVELPQITSLAPDGRSLLVFTIEDFDVAGRDRAVLFDEHGTRLWDRMGVTALSGATWSPDGTRLAVTGERGQWFLAGREDGAFVERAVEVDDGPNPSPSSARPAYDERLQPLGFSDDGAWVYGAHYSAARGIGRPYVRVAFASGAVEPLDHLPPLGAGTPLSDGLGGRSVGFEFNASAPGGPPSLAIREPDGTVAFRVDVGHPLGVSFSGDGRSVVVLSGDGYATAGRVRLVVLDHDGQPGPPLLDVGPIASAALIGVHGDYAAVLLSTSGREREGQLIVVRLDDGRASAVNLPADDVSIAVNSGWLPGP